MYITHRVHLFVSKCSIDPLSFWILLTKSTNQNPRFLGFTYRMESLLEYCGYHSRHFVSMTGIGNTILYSIEWITAVFLPFHYVPDGNMSKTTNVAHISHFVCSIIRHFNTKLRHPHLWFGKPIAIENTYKRCCLYPWTNSYYTYWKKNVIFNPHVAECLRWSGLHRTFCPMWAEDGYQQTPSTPVDMKQVRKFNI